MKRDDRATLRVGDGSGRERRPGHRRGSSLGNEDGEEDSALVSMAAESRLPLRGEDGACRRAVAVRINEDAYGSLAGKDGRTAWPKPVAKAWAGHVGGDGRQPGDDGGDEVTARSGCRRGDHGRRASADERAPLAVESPRGLDASRASCR